MEYFIEQKKKSVYNKHNRENSMSLSGNIKSEIIKKNPFKKQEKSVLQGLFLSCGSLIVSNAGIKFSLASDFEDVIGLKNVSTNNRKGN